MATVILLGVNPLKLPQLTRILENDFPEVVITSGNQSDHQDVGDFHQKFGLPRPLLPHILDPVTFDYRRRFLHEELTELEEAYEKKDLHGYADALIDLVYVAHGTAVMSGIPWAPLWHQVHLAKMSKVRATSPEQSKRGSALDVIKPVDWVAPDFTSWLGPK